jgi:hypothetical protein
MKGPDPVARDQRLEGVEPKHAAYVHESNRAGDGASTGGQGPSEIGQSTVGHRDEHDRLRLRLERPNQPWNAASGCDQPRRMPGCLERPGEAPSDLASARDDERSGQRPVGRPV